MSAPQVTSNELASSTEEEAALERPRRPLSAYNLFFKFERQQLLNERPVRAEGAPRRSHGKMGFANMAKTIAAKWNNIDPESKRHFTVLARQEKLRYKKALAEWKKSQRDLAKNKRQESSASPTAAAAATSSTQMDDKQASGPPNRHQFHPQEEEASNSSFPHKTEEERTPSVVSNNSNSPYHQDHFSLYRHQEPQPTQHVMNIPLGLGDDASMFLNNSTTAASHGASRSPPLPGHLVRLFTSNGGVGHLAQQLQEDGVDMFIDLFRTSSNNKNQRS
uniref:HMG box domain-containing protein n=1 Tax=Entomoneis paludosa TaxID=265537 RepID=A0A7S2YGL6_9STRA|mmetsp:Transcript_31816/g.66404  ORF Transcript_31816/g.66404 Transcript_31816/m.66404 type:complete len:277 (+) Transcript_31816:397-1227(+)|eukprot:CAMPEP_0172439092 /NCGR_PEP_ID=MMETSP1065-20121228/183_1 /TAXON_ID=265537 /ORGANISM="Amphiprora paludosa, Strain CCMP125" /LENGTH=276 /DNA_ID=CAMNT_0013187719 /DNA_START=304 /DNA_END=1134 /DNA_ORIENTATION=-